MKYLNALLKAEENPTPPTTDTRQNRQKPLVSVLSGASPRSTGEIEQASGLLSRPYLNDQGELIIPFGCDPHYCYWKPGGQSIAKTLAELDAPPEVWRRYVKDYSESLH